MKRPKFQMESNYNFLYSNKKTDTEDSEEQGDQGQGSTDRDQVKDRVKTKFATMMVNNSWNDKNERLIVSIGENSACYKWMHEKSAQMYNFISTALGLSLVILNTGLSAQTIIPNNIIIIQNVIIYIVTLISVIKSFLKYEELGSKHLVYAGKFAEIYHKIQQQMVLYRKDRINAVEFIRKTLRLYDELIVSGPEINHFVRNKFKKLFLSSDINVPDIADRIQRIEIITEIPGSDNKTTTTPPQEENGHLTRSFKPNLFCIQNDITDEDLDLSV